MKQVKSAGLVMALGLMATLGACSDAPTTGEGEAPTPSSDVTTAVDEGGEGGEEGAPQSEDADVNYMVALGLMKGHLIVAKSYWINRSFKKLEPHIVIP